MVAWKLSFEILYVTYIEGEWALLSAFTDHSPPQGYFLLLLLKVLKTFHYKNFNVKQYLLKTCGLEGNNEAT